MIIFVIKVVRKLLLFKFVVRLKDNILNNIINIGYKLMVIKVMCLKSYIVILLMVRFIIVFIFIWLVNSESKLIGLVVLFWISVIRLIVRNMVIGLFDVFFSFSVDFIFEGMCILVLCRIENIVVVFVDFIIVLSNKFL